MNSKHAGSLFLGFVMVLGTISVARAQESGSSEGQAAQADNKGDAHQSCAMSVEQREETGMGFSQAKTTHHFGLTRDGGVISVEAKDAKDMQSRGEIRMHLAHIARAFADGDFDIPMLVHDQTPPGVPVMKSKKDQIRYRVEETELGGKVVIRSEDREALSAIHDFLAFQIRQHKTGDNLKIQ